MVQVKAPAEQRKTAPLILRDKHLAILLLVHELDGCCFSHLRYWLWPDAKSQTRNYEAIQQLVQAGYLFSRRLASVSGQGTGQAWLTTSKRGRDLLADLVSPEELEVTSNSEPPRYFIHDIAVRTFRLMLQTVCKRSTAVEQLSWTNESYFKRHPIRVPDPASATGQADLAPDGAFTLTLSDGSSRHYFFEWDRDRITKGRFQKKVRDYMAYLTRSAATSTPVLLVVPTERRRREITTWVAEEADRLGQRVKLEHYFWIALGDDVTDQTMFQPIWQVVGGPNRVPLLAQSQTRRADS